jgi:ribosomal protein S27E
MYAFGVVSGMLLSWGWLVFASPAARRNVKDSHAGMVEVRCTNCGRMNWTVYSEVRTDGYCVRCA